VRGTARARLGRATPLGAATVAAYLLVLALIQATGWPDWETLASSPNEIARGQVWLLLTSGLVIDGLPWAQWSVLAIVLGTALVVLGTARLWIVALSAHVGATLIAYVGVLVLWLVDSGSVVGTAGQADYGISVIIAGELGALAAVGGRRIALLVGAAALVAFGIGVADSSALANAEHLLGFAVGALVGLFFDRYARKRQHAALAGD
jgi:hypothetical protein